LSGSPSPLVGEGAGGVRGGAHEHRREALPWWIFGLFGGLLAVWVAQDYLPANLRLPPLAADRIFAGRFELRQMLGEGGMGAVWDADQIQPVRRRVALKVIRPGLDSARLLARFDQERQALALCWSEQRMNVRRQRQAERAERDRASRMQRC